MTKFTGSNGNVHVAASIRLMDGTLLNGTVNCGLTGKLESVLGQENAFVEFRSREGQQRFISRHQIASVEASERLRAPQLPAVSDNDVDPYVILEIFGEKTQDIARDAYMRLTKVYHPDKWSGEDIPKEIQRYAAEMTRAINVAYTAVRADLQQKERAAAQDAIRAQAPSPAPASQPMGASAQQRMFGGR